MVRSKSLIISVKVPVKWEAMTERTKQRLRQTVGRDTRVIRAFLGVIEQHEDELVTGRYRNRIDASKLDKLTMTALRVKSGLQQRVNVPHDFKVRFPRISKNELTECRQSAVAQYESYLRLRQKKGRKTSRPCVVNGTRRIPRWVFSRRFQLIEHKTLTNRWWLDLLDSLDSAPEGRRVHDRLMIPLKVSPFHLNQMRRGEAKALQVYIDRQQKWWVTFAIRVELSDTPDTSLQVAVLGIDLGIEKAACTALLTPEKVRETKYFKQEHKIEFIKKYDRLVAYLQREMAIRKNHGLAYDKLAGRLRNMRSKRARVAKEHDRVLVGTLIDYILQLSQKYNLYVALGQLRNIRRRAQKGDYKGRRFRGMIHRWAFARVSDMLQHGLAQLGWIVEGKNSRFKAVSEAWTSIMCWKCGSKGKRPKQNYFHCPACGHKTNADRNGAINIAGRLITLTKLLHGVRGLGKWASAVARSTRLKARKKKPSKGKSLLSSKDQTSGLGESAAVHFVQRDLSSFSDESRLSDDDPAVVRTVETLTVAGSDVPAPRQEKEARTVGGKLSR
jgi:transposase